jgi:alkylation response protein AidB-like acyl-CoA dehydrogenase
MKHYWVRSVVPRPLVIAEAQGKTAMRIIGVGGRARRTRRRHPDEVARSVRSCEVVEQLYRDIRALRSYEGATEVQKLIIGRDVLKAA